MFQITELTDIDKKAIERYGEDWYLTFKNVFQSSHIKKISSALYNEYKNHVIYPEPEDIFKAFKLTRLQETKVVIIGQDPYYNGKANGLAFGYNTGVPELNKKGSLEIIFDEIERDIKYGLFLNQDATLEYLAKQGVLLLNTCLTVRKGAPKSHKSLRWDVIIGEIIRKLFIIKENLVFMVWGHEAYKFLHDYGHLYDADRHLILKAPHPASDLYNSDSFNNIIPNYPKTFSGCNHFSKANKFLKEKGLTEIQW